VAPAGEILNLRLPGMNPLKEAKTLQLFAEEFRPPGKNFVSGAVLMGL
jgi:hypothetical protein